MNGGWRATDDLSDRFERYVQRTDGCWPWIGTITTAGYGHLEYSGSTHQAHRVAYQLFRGRIPADKEIDHLCRVRHCVNPYHLEIVTHQENMKRGVWPKRPVCLHGLRRKRDCYDCREVYRRRYEEKKKRVG
jgi:hypothetical protein